MIIGLTGMTGAGKSTAAKILAAMGCYVIDADEVGHRVTDTAAVLEKIKSAFGAEYITPDGRLDRRALGRLVFADREKLRLLNEITHPAIRAEILAEAEAHSDGDVVIDCALLGESGLDRVCDRVLNITATKELRLRRIIKRDGISEREALDRINSQKPYSGPCAYIDNSAGERELEARLREVLWQES